MPTDTEPRRLRAIAAHLRNCLVLTTDARAIVLILDAARSLEDRADEVQRPHATPRAPKAPSPSP